MLATKQPVAALKALPASQTAKDADSSATLIRDLAALRMPTRASAKSASPRQQKDSARAGRGTENVNAINRPAAAAAAAVTAVSTFTGSSSALLSSPSGKNKAVSASSSASSTPVKKKALLSSASSASDGSGDAMVTPKKGLMVSSSSSFTSALSGIPTAPHDSAAASAVFAPPSPIASASPTARRIRIAMHAPAASAAPVAPLLSPSSSSSSSLRRSPSRTDGLRSGGGDSAKKSSLFSPAYARAEEERLRRERLSAKRMTKQKARTQLVAASSPIVTVQTTAACTAPAPASPSSAASSAGEEDTFDPLLFIRNLPPLSSLPPHRIPPLPAKRCSHRVTLCLDLDETLVHCSIQPIPRPSLTFSVSFSGQSYTVYCRLRPYLSDFLRAVSAAFEVVIFTASQQVYADTLLDILDRDRALISHRVFRDSCLNFDGNFLKDLSVLGRDLQVTAIVDNSIQAFGYQLENGIPIESWFDDEDDRELMKLLPFLMRLRQADDVRPLITETFRLQEMIDKIQ